MRVTRQICTYIIFLAALFGCSGRNEGWGVLLWSPDGSAYDTGQIVLVSDVSKLNNTYDIRADKREPTETVEQWRIAFFKRKSTAEEYQDVFSEYANLYAVTSRDGLAVWAKRSTDAKRTYKLREGEVSKVLSRDDEKSVAGGFEGYWYLLLTAGGVTGYSFDKYLEVLSTEQLSLMESPEERDEFLEYFLSSVFRPKYYKYMLEDNRIDLNRFLPDYGVFPEPENGEIHIVTEKHASTIEYTSISRVTKNTYAFEESTLLLIVKNPYEVNLQYSDQGVQYSEEFVRIDQDIDLLIIEETERREGLFENLYELGNLLSSSAYGTITLFENGEFLWEGYERLVPGVIDPEAGETGRIDFRLHLGSELAEAYDGAISFVFDSTEVVDFLYTLENQGIRFKYLDYQPGKEPLLVKDDGTSPIVIFFRISTTESE